MWTREKSARQEEVWVLRNKDMSVLAQDSARVILKSHVQTLQILWPTGSKVHSPSLSIIIKQSPFLWAGYRKVTMTVTGLLAEGWEPVALDFLLQCMLEMWSARWKGARGGTWTLNLETYWLSGAREGFCKTMRMGNKLDKIKIKFLHT